MAAGLDKPQGTELTLFIENDGNLYRQVAQPIIKNFARKKLNKKFNKVLAIKGILHLVEAGRRGYIRAFGGLGSQVSMATKLFVAKELFQWINEESTFEAKKLRKAMKRPLIRKILKRKIVKRLVKRRLKK